MDLYKAFFFFLNNLVGILNVCGLENILGSSVGEKSNGIIFATFLRQACVEVPFHKV